MRSGMNTVDHGAAFAPAMKAMVSLCRLSSQYNAQKAGITSAIVIAVLLPIGICGFCLLLQLRNKAADVREKKEGGGGGYNTYNQGPM